MLFHCATLALLLLQLRLGKTAAAEGKKGSFKKTASFFLGIFS